MEILSVKRQVKHYLITTTKYNKMLEYDCINKEVLKYIYLRLYNKYVRKKANKLRMNLVTEEIMNENAEIKIDTWIKTYIFIKNNGPNIFVYDKK